VTEKILPVIVIGIGRRR